MSKTYRSDNLKTMLESYGKFGFFFDEKLKACLFDMLTFLNQNDFEFTVSGFIKHMPIIPSHKACVIFKFDFRNTSIFYESVFGMPLCSEQEYFIRFEEKDFVTHLGLLDEYVFDSVNHMFSPPYEKLSIKKQGCDKHAFISTQKEGNFVLRQIGYSSMESKNFNSFVDVAGEVFSERE